MKVLVTGSTGLVGSALVPFLETDGHEVARLVRSAVQRESDIQWNPKTRAIETARLEGIDGVVHLAGENIASRRWSQKQKARIRDSRVEGTEFLCETLKGLEKPPKVLISASAIGYYGNQGDPRLDEDSPPGTGFLPDVCVAWEAATGPAVEKGIRVVNLRFGIILSPGGGPLGKMLPFFRMGLGGVVGDGEQFMSWISLDDVLGVIRRSLVTDTLRGPVNTVSPQPVTNREFTKTLGRVLHRPTLFPLPAFAARLILGEMADELLLASARVQPKKLLDVGYEFRTPDLVGALRHVLGQ